VQVSCECGNEPSGFIKRWKVLKWLHKWWLASSAQSHRVSELITH
jgi:hypothetical protein